MHFCRPWWQNLKYLLGSFTEPVWRARMQKAELGLGSEPAEQPGLEELREEPGWPGVRYTPGRTACTVPGLCQGRSFLPAAKALGTCPPPALRPTAGPQSFQSCQLAMAHGSSGFLPSWPGLECVVNRRVALRLVRGRERGIRAGNCCVKMTAQQFIHPKRGPGIPRGCRRLGINTAPEEGLLGREGGLKDPYGSDDCLFPHGPSAA